MDKLALLGFKSQITDDLSGVFVDLSGVSSLGHLNLKGLRLAGRISGHLGNLSLQKMPSSTTKHAVKIKSLVLEHNTLVGQIPYQIGPLTNYGRIVKFRRLKDPSGIRTDVTKEDQEREVYLPASAAFLGNGTDKLDLLGFKSQITEDLFRVFVSWNYSIHFCQCPETRKSHSFESQRAKGFGNLRIFCGSTFGVTNLDTLPCLLYYVNKISGNCSQLLKLGISENSLTGTIPQQLFALSSLTDIYASYNSLTGPSPVYIGNWGHLTYLYFSHNNISAKIPRTPGKFLALGEIYLKGNSLQATIPNLKDLSDLQSVDLSQHKLSGPIPHFIASLTSLLFLNFLLELICQQSRW
ncbi:hypothetical protein EJD97_000715 [Solanum chilense]|uniref:Leucine-rich repeat-containing N-terminal plant-type domain-containing protein n=1 Tax=Solanum chilense TaxID=4083 RepID=A0A6N2AQ78_SOLCI|nr:hypothetical protein EJD97_000715 [Solanum chilense]